MRALLYTTGSPYARGVRIILHELGLDYEAREEITTPTAAQRAQATPTLQVPTLWDGGYTLWESGLIAEYLLSNYAERPNTAPPLAESAWRTSQEWRDKLIFATVQTLGGAATTVSQMKWSGVPHGDNAHLTRCAERLPNILAWLSDELPDGGDGFIPGVLSVQDIFLACHLRFIQNRPLDLDPDLQRFPKIEALLARLDARESFQANPILWWEPGVTGYADDGRTPIYGDA